MNHRLIPSLVIVAFLALTLCGWGLLTFANQHTHMDGSSHAQHYRLLVSAFSAQILSIIILLGSLALSRGRVFAEKIRRPPLRHTLAMATPLWYPLQEPFSNGILNPKPF